MPARSDVIVNWNSSPRVITVLAPSSTISIQDLLDTCREAEDDLPNLVYSSLASAAGKENLGGGVSVGITLTLLNAVLAFEARVGPTYVQCRVGGGNLVAIDEFGSDLSPIAPTAFTQVLTTASSSATIVTGSADITAIVDGVWNEPKSNHTTPGSIGNDIATKKDVIVTAIAFR